ncbi:hypothetical protein J6590_021147 [Homalodisca vitripennis]|nr:hypothetical protein J6590_021147 [Homalodisca vitripennis]
MLMNALATGYFQGFGNSHHAESTVQAQNLRDLEVRLTSGYLIVIGFLLFKKSPIHPFPITTGMFLRSSFLLENPLENIRKVNYGNKNGGETRTGQVINITRSVPNRSAGAASADEEVSGVAKPSPFRISTHNSRGQPCQTNTVVSHRRGWNRPINCRLNRAFYHLRGPSGTGTEIRGLFLGELLHPARESVTVGTVTYGMRKKSGPRSRRSSYVVAHTRIGDNGTDGMGRAIVTGVWDTDSTDLLGRPGPSSLAETSFHST